MSTTGQFDTDTAVTRVSEGVYGATFGERWNVPGGTPNGGYSLGVTLRALAHSMSPHGRPKGSYRSAQHAGCLVSELGLPDPLVVAAFFLRRASTGSAEVRTELARVGRRTATGEARLWRDGQETARAVATFTDLTRSRGRTVELGRAPELPPPQACIDPRAGRPMPGVTMAERIDIRCERPPGWLVGRPSGAPSASFWMRFADGRDADTLSPPTLVDACTPAAMELGARGSATVELTVHVRARPARDWLACRVSTRHVSAGYHDEDFEIWDSAGQLVAQGRQLALLPQADA